MLLNQVDLVREKLSNVVLSRDQLYEIQIGI